MYKVIFMAGEWFIHINNVLQSLLFKLKLIARTSITCGDLETEFFSHMKLFRAFVDDIRFYNDTHKW